MATPAAIGTCPQPRSTSIVWVLWYSVSALSRAPAGTHFSSPEVVTAVDRPTGRNGEKVYLTLSRIAAGKDATIVVVESRLGSTVTTWLLAVSQ
jgi:hypothetical protein